MDEAGEFYTYLLGCADGTLYAGWTTEPQRRLEQHNLGKGAKYTRARLPVTLQATWQFATKAEAMRFEWQLKRMTRAQKLRLIAAAKQAD
jgi:putative endonuclease